MSIACIGLNHATAPFELLESLSLNSSQMLELLGRLKAETVLQEIAGLSTCNRTEFYFVAEDEAAVRRCLGSHVAAIRSTDAHGALSQSYFHRDEGAVRHLFRVASGIDSLVVGEKQILGQLRQAHELAVEAGSVAAVLNTLLPRAILVGRRVRNETRISQGNVSVASVAVTIAGRIFTSLANKTVVVLGAGDMAEVTARNLIDRGVGRLVVVNRSLERARELAAQLEVEAQPWTALAEALTQADIVISAVAAPTAVITREMARDAMRSRALRPLLFLDLSMPRNIEATVTKIDQVFLYGIENLNQMAHENRAERQSEILKVEEIIDQEVLRYQRLTTTADANRLAAQLRRRAEVIRQSQIDRHGRQLTEEERERLDRFTDSLLRSVLHDVTANIRSIDLDSEEGQREFETACRLFNIDPDTIQDQ